MRPFLHDPIGVAADPNVILLVDETAMDRFGHLLRIAPCVHDVAVGIIFDDDRRRLLADGLLHRREIGPVHAEDVILAVDADAADRPRHPSIGQRFRPIGINDEARDVAIRRASGPIRKHENNCGPDQARQHSPAPCFERKRRTGAPRQQRIHRTLSGRPGELVTPGPPTAHEDQTTKSTTVTGEFNPSTWRGLPSTRSKERLRPACR